MNKINNPLTDCISIVAENEFDKLVCKRALGAAQVRLTTVLTLDYVEPRSPLEADISEEIARGLANIALGEYGERGFSGLTQEGADQKLSELSGSIDDFISAILED